MKRLPLILGALILSVGIFPRNVLALAESCNTDAYVCTCTNANDSVTLITAPSPAPTTATECDAYCYSQLTDTYTETCTLPTSGRVVQVGEGTVTIPAPATPGTPVKAFVVPVLNVQIPGFNGLFDTPTSDGKSIQVNFIGQYIGAVYNWILGAAALVAVVMMMIGGLQYVMSRGKEKYITKAKERITNAITGVILLLLAYNIAFFIDPDTLGLKGISIRTVSAIVLDEAIHENLTSPGVSDLKGKVPACAETTLASSSFSNQALVTAINNASPHVDPILLAAHIQQESGGVIKAKTPGVCGEIGPSQFLPTTAVAMNVSVPKECCANVIAKSSNHTKYPCATSTASPSSWPPNSTTFPSAHCIAACGHCEVASDSCVAWFDPTVGNNLQNIINTTAGLIAHNLGKTDGDLAQAMAAYNGSGGQAATYAKSVAAHYEEICIKSGNGMYKTNL